MGDAMPTPDPLMDEDENEADRRAVADLEADVPQSGNGPDPADLEDINPSPPASPPVDLTPPDVGAEGPTQQVPIDMAGAPAAPPPEAAKAEPVSEDIARRQGEQDAEKAKIDAQTAQRMADEAKLADEDARLERADYLERRQAAEKDLNDKIARYSSAQLTDPRARTSTKSKLSVIFGGLGAMYRDIGGSHDTSNHALDQLQRQWHDDMEIQKANIAGLRDNAVMARTRLEDVDAGRREMLRDADARLLAKYNLAIRQGEAQLKGRGVNQAAIDADARIVKLRQGQRAAQLQAQKDADAHALNQARINRLNAQAARDQRKGAGGGGKSSKQALAERRAALADKREERAEAGPVIKEMDESLKEFHAKGGVKESLEHSERSLAAVDKDPANPTNWVNLVDAMIRSNTGRSAILSQYKLYTGKAAGSIDEAAQLFHKLADGGLSDTQKTNLLSAAKTSNGELRGAAKDVYDNFRDYENDPRVKANPEINEHFVRTERNMFGTLPGYQKPAKAQPAAPAKKAAPPPSAQQDSKAVKWAKAHLDDPRAKSILAANGAL